MLAIIRWRIFQYAIQKHIAQNIQNYNFAWFFFWYDYDTWSLKLREERSLRVFVNRVLKNTFEPKRDEVTGG